MPIGTQVLVVSAHPQLCRSLILALDKANFTTAVAFSVDEAMDVLSQSEIPVICTCAELRDGDYRMLLDAVGSRGLKSRVVLMAEQEETYLAAMECGAFDFLQVPFLQKEVERIVCNALAAGDPQLDHAMARSA